MRLILFAALCLPTIHALAQWRPSPFPATAPVAGYVLQRAFPTIPATSPNRLIGLTSDSGKLFIIEGSGVVYVITNLAVPNRTVFLDNRADTWNLINESGLFGLAFHPSGDYVFTFGNETNRAAGTMMGRLVRWTVDPANRNRVLPASKLILIDQLDEEPTHTGGDLKFGPDGYLYVPLGDEGGSPSSFNIQRIDRDFFSGILRLDVDERPGSLAPNPHPAVRPGYRIPPDNPWVNATSFNGKAVNASAVRTEFWAVGLRSPFRMNFDFVTGDLYVGDVGGAKWEEFNKIVRGGNYGWNLVEGPEVRVVPNPPVAFEAPFWSYPHTTTAPPGADPRFLGNCGVGGFVYRGSKYPSLNGKYLCADWTSKNIWAVTLSPVVTVEQIGTASSGVTAFAMNPLNGDILVAEASSGIISKLVPAPDTTAIPPTLSATGVFSDLATMTPASGVLPYEVASPFWSDNAVKTRWFFLPPGGVVSRSASDQWSFPVGTVWIKHFDLPVVSGTSTTRKIETRFTVKTATGIYGLTYQWRPDLSDADLVPDAGLDTEFAVENPGGVLNQPWHYPARTECLSCHNPTAGFALGFSTRQMNVNAAVAGGGAVNQLLGLSDLGVFSPAFTTVSGLVRLSRPLDESATLEHRFKSYTDANCAYCHQPGGAGRGEWDARFSTPLEQSSIINGTVLDNLGVTGASILTPGSLERSVLYRRVADFVGPNLPADYHMPPLATSQRNEAGVTLLERFINGLQGRTSWLIGTFDDRHSEFSRENGIDNLAPGGLAVDDDYYTAGQYPVGFNRLVTPLSVSADEPSINWERALSRSDRTNRLHFVTAYGGRMSLTSRLFSGGWKLNNVTQPGFGDHDIVIRHVAGGISTILWQGRISSARTINVPFTAGPGANTVEYVRTGPLSASSYWINFDAVSIEPAP